MAPKKKLKGTGNFDKKMAVINSVLFMQHRRQEVTQKRNGPELNSRFFRVTHVTDTTMKRILFLEFIQNSVCVTERSFSCVEV